MLPNHNKGLQQLIVLDPSTVKHSTQMNTTSPKNLFKVLQLNANGIRNRTDELQLLIKNTQGTL